MPSASNTISQPTRLLPPRRSGPYFSAVVEGQVEKQDTSGNERERECESKTVDHVMHGSQHVFVLENDFKRLD